MNLTANQIADLALAQQLVPRLEPVAQQATPRLEPAKTPALRAFIVQIKNGPKVRLQLEVMARNRQAAVQQHEDLCEPGEYVWAQTPEEAREAAFAAFDRQRNLDKSTGADLDRRAARHAEAEERARRLMFGEAF